MYQSQWGVKINNLSTFSFEDYYFSPTDDIVQDFFIPALQRSINYDCATGYFTSDSLVELSVGICDLVSRGGKIHVITSPKLKLEDVEAIRNGYDKRKKIGEVMVRDFKKPDDPHSINRLTLISELIARGVLEIKIAIMKNLDNYPNSIFHPKFGIMQDMENNAISYMGSMNETHNGLLRNWESIGVNSTLNGNEKKVKKLKDTFDNLWANDDKSTIVMDMPEVVDKLLSSYRTGEFNLDLDKELIEIYNESCDSVYFKSPSNFKLRDYQKEAIDNWINNAYKGIFNMATGTGKTKTALCALEKLYNSHPDEGIFTIVVAPQKHLVEQWKSEIENFNVSPIVGHSNSSNRNWKESLKHKIMLHEYKGGNFCLVTTIASFSSNDLQQWVSNIKNLAVVFDEAHNMGSDLRLTMLPENAKYRLALSATIRRYKDAHGTYALEDYFKKECINLPIEDAIGRYLTNYYYHPIVCYYNKEEYDELIKRNEKLNSILYNPHSTHKDIIEAKKEYIHYKHTINIQMKSKYEALFELMSRNVDLDHFLIYCGKGKIDSEKFFEDKDLNEMIDSIDKVIQIIGKNGIGFDVSRITYRENAQERKKIIQDFDKGDISGIVAISCLDEGVDIPSISTAVFMSSSNNPREYIQRRGRVLRLHPGKEYSRIYDMIALPKDLDYVDLNDMHSGLELKMIAEELLRINEFSRISLNFDESLKLINKIECAYGYSLNSILEKYGGENDENY